MYFVQNEISFFQLLYNFGKKQQHS